MTKRMRRIVAFLLTMVFLFSAFPAAMASELPGEEGQLESLLSTEFTEATENTEPTPDIQEDNTEAAEPLPTEVQEPVFTTPADPEDETEPNIPTDEPGLGESDNPMLDADLLDPDLLLDDAALLALGTAGGVLFFDQANPNYTTYLSSQVSVTYRPNGTDGAVTAYIKNLGWHFARYNNTAYEDDPLYCIEPCKNFGASTSGNYMDTDVPLSGSGSSRGTNVWYALPESYRNSIALTLLYSKQMWNNSYSVKTTPMASNPNVPLRVATQFLIYEIVTGLRDANTFIRNGSNGYTSGDVFYNAGVNSVSGFADCYNTLVSSIQSAMTIPSFTSDSYYYAPTINLTGSTTCVTDYNGVLSNFSFTNGNGVSFDKRGNDLYINQTGTVSSGNVFTATRSIPSAANSTFAIYYSASSSYQTCVNLYTPSVGSLNAYFRLSVPTGTLGLTKTTEDGKNLSGWQFSIYANEACTSLVSGPHTTDSSGRITVSNLTAGTYYVKEIGNVDAAVNSSYTCSSANPLRVTISSGTTTSVTFQNNLTKGGVKIIKQTNTGENLSGWQIGLYTDEACTAPVPGSPFTTGEDGTVTAGNLNPGTYYAREVGSTDPYWVCDNEVKPVSVTTGTTASVTFTNIHYGKIQFQKTTNTGRDLGGWTFRLYNSDYEIVGEYTTDESGYAVTPNLLPGRYTVLELPVEDKYWQVEIGYHSVIVDAGKTAVDTWLNRNQGLAWFYKKTNTGENLAGWEITVYSDPECTAAITTLTTNEEGYTGYYMDPGTYYAKETGDTMGRFENEYWLVDESIQEFTIEEHKDTPVTFTNVQYGRLQIQKSMETDGPIAGWQFRVTDESGTEVSGSPFTTDETGVILIDRLLPGAYTVEEIIPEGCGYTCLSINPQVVSIVQGQIAEASFVNGRHPGKIALLKVNHRNEPLPGVVFRLEWSTDGANWQPISYTDGEMAQGTCSNAAVQDGCLTTDSNGCLEWNDLTPNLQYRITEVTTLEGYQLLTDYAYVGELPAETLELSLRVTNCPSYALPETGANTLLLMQILGALALFGGLAIPALTRRKEV